MSERVSQTNEYAALLLHTGRLVRAYLWALGGGLLGQGLLSLLFLAIWPSVPTATHGVFNFDVLHCIIHVVWGIVMLAALLGRQPTRRLVDLTLTFAVFYSLLALAGIVYHHPLGMYLDDGQNGFHTLIGLLGLLLGCLGLYERRVLRRIAAESA